MREQVGGALRRAILVAQVDTLGGHAGIVFDFGHHASIIIAPTYVDTNQDLYGTLRKTEHGWLREFNLSARAGSDGRLTVVPNFDDLFTDVTRDVSMRELTR
jgi:hypothetical protein